MVYPYNEDQNRRPYMTAMPSLREAMGPIDNFASGVRQGWNTGQSMFDAGVAGLARAVGANDTARDWEQSADEQAREAAQYANPSVQVAPWREGGGGWANAAPWLVNQAGQLVGGVAPLVAGGVAGMAAAPLIPEAVGGAALASGLGMGIASFPQAVGANYQAERDANAAQGLGEVTPEQAQSAAIWGVPSAALNAFAPTKAIGIGQTASQMASRTMLEAAKDVAKVGIDNALATGGQKAIEQSFRPDISEGNKSKDMFDSIVTGFIGGAAMGGAGEVAGRTIKAIRPDAPTQDLDAFTKSILEPEKAAQEAVQERGPEGILPREPAEAGEPMGGGDALGQEATAARSQDVEGNVSFLDEGQAPAPQEVGFPPVPEIRQPDVPLQYLVEADRAARDGSLAEKIAKLQNDASDEAKKKLSALQWVNGLSGDETERNRLVDAKLLPENDDKVKLVDKQSILGPKFSGFEGRWAEAVGHLSKLGSGDAVGVLSHPEINHPIDVVWGKAGERGYGLAKIAEKHPEVLPDLPERLQRMKAIEQFGDRTVLASEDGNERAVIDGKFGGNPKTWLLTAYDKKSEGQSSGGLVEGATGLRDENPSSPRLLAEQNLVQPSVLGKDSTVAVPKQPEIIRKVGGAIARFIEDESGVVRIPSADDAKQPVDFPAGTPDLEGPMGRAPAMPPAPPPKSIAPVPMDALSARPAEDVLKPIKSWSLKAAKNSAAKFWADETGSIRLPFQREDGAPLRTPDDINNALRDTITKLDDAKSGFGEQMRKLGLYVTTRRHQDEMYGNLMPSQLTYSKGVDHRSAVSARMQALAMANQAFFNNFKKTDKDAFQRSMNVERAYQLGMDASKPWEQQPDRVRKGDSARYKEIHRQAAADLANLRGNGKTALLDTIREQYETHWASKPAAVLYMLLKDEELPDNLRSRLVDPSEALINSPDEALNPSMANRHFANSLDEMMAIAKEYLDGQEKLPNSRLAKADPNKYAVLTDVKNPLPEGEELLQVKGAKPYAPESILRTFVKEIEAQKGKLKEVPYSHLMRHGKYGLGFRIALDADGNVRSDAVENIRKSVADAGFRNIVIEPMGDQNYVFIRSDSQSQINNLKKALVGAVESGDVLRDDFKVGTMDVFDQSPAASKVVGDLIKKIKSSDRYKAPEGASDELRSGLAKRQAQMVAALQDMMVDLLPETSAARSAVHRDYIPGFEGDPLQALAKQSIETAQHVANLLGTARVHDALTQMRSEWEAAKDPLNPNNSYEPLMAALYRNNVMREEGRGVDNAARSWVDTFQGLNYSYFLGFNPSFALIQTMQVPMYVIPELAKRAGYMKSTRAVAKVTKDSINVMRAVWNEAKKAGGTALADMPITTEALMNAGLKEDTARFMVHMVNSGGIDTGGLSRSLSGISERRVGGFWDAYTRWAAFMGYYAETFTRVQSALAAKEVFKGDVSTPEGWNKLIDYSQKIINQGLFDYQNENKARAFNGNEKSLLGNATKLSTAFQSYWFMALEKMYREMHALMVGAHLAKKRPGITDAQAKIEAKEAAKFLLGHAAATSVIAGSLALPGVNMLAGLYDKLADIADPEDGPHDIREGWSSWLEKVFGPRVGDAIARGAPRLIGQDVSSRTTEADFIPFSSFVADRDTMRNKVKKQASKLWGAPEGALENIAGGIDKFNAGDYKGAAIDLLVPAAGLRNVANAAKEATNDRFTDSRGHTIPNVDVTPSTIASRVIGFKPTTLARYQEENQMLKRYDTGIELEARNLVMPMVDALRDGDKVAFNRMLPKAREFERMHPGHKIVDRAQETFKREYKELNTAEKTGMPYQRWKDDPKRKQRAQRYVDDILNNRGY